MLSPVLDKALLYREGSSIPAMKIVCISDTHGKVYPKLPEGDMLIHAGDISIWGDDDTIQMFINWFASQPHKYKVFIAGNHDSGLEKKGIKAYNLPDDVHYLENSSIELGGLKIWGSPYTRTFGSWSFMLAEEDLAIHYASNLPHDADIVITHGPAVACLDQAHVEHEHLGDASLAYYLASRTPKLHVCGHIHGGYGLKQRGPVTHVNAAQLDEAYQPTNKPIVVEVEP